MILEDHFASDAINAGVAAQAGFVASFDGEAVAELGDLRAQFLRKAVMAGTDQVCRPLVAAGVTPGRAAGADPRRRPGVTGAGAAAPAPRRAGPPGRRRRPAAHRPGNRGAGIEEAAVPLHLRKARVTQAGIEANTSICSGMFRVRYPDGWTP